MCFVIDQQKFARELMEEFEENFRSLAGEDSEITRRVINGMCVVTAMAIAKYDRESQH